MKNNKNNEKRQEDAHEDYQNLSGEEKRKHLKDIKNLAEKEK